MQFRVKSWFSSPVFEGNSCRIFIFPFFCTKIGTCFWQYRTSHHFHFFLRSSILVSTKEVSNTMNDRNDLMEMQQCWGTEEREIVNGVKTLIHYLFRS